MQGLYHVPGADDNGDGWRQIAREARQRAERAEMRHLELDRDLLAAQSERQELINKLAKGAEEALRLERQVSDTKAQGENLRLDDEAHRQHWQQMHDQMQEQRRRAEQAEVERDAAQARIVELLGEGQELRQTHAAAAAELNDIQCIAAQALRCEVPQEGSQPALTLVKNLRSALEKTERARDGWRGRALESERIRSLYAPGWTPVNGPHGRPCPGCQGCEPLMAHPMDLCSGSAWVAPAGCLGCAKAAGKTDGTECAIHGAAKEAISAPPGIRAKVDHEIPLTEMRRERDAAVMALAPLLALVRDLAALHPPVAYNPWTTTARRLISEARNLTGWRDDTAEGSSVAVTATDRPDPPRAIRLLITRPAPTHETIQCLFKWIGGISLGETHRVLVDLCNMGRIVNRGLPWGYRLVDEAAVHMEPPAPLGTTPGGYEVSAESPAAPPAARLRSLLGHEPVRPVGWSADMWGAFPGEGFPEDGPVLLAYREDTLRNVVSAAGLGCDLTILPCAVDGAFDNDVSAIPADVPTGQEDQHDADMRAEEAHDFGETRCRRCNRHRLDAAAPCVRA